MARSIRTAKYEIRGLGLTQEDLAKIAGVHRVTVSAYLNGLETQNGLAYLRLQAALSLILTMPRERWLEASSKGREKLIERTREKVEKQFERLKNP